MAVWCPAWVGVPEPQWDARLGVDAGSISGVSCLNLEPIWEANSRQLEASIDILRKLLGYSRARAEIYERSEPIRLELGKGVPSQAKAIEFFDAHASALLAG